MGSVVMEMSWRLKHFAEQESRSIRGQNWPSSLAVCSCNHTKGDMVFLYIQNEHYTDSVIQPRKPRA